MNSMKEVYAATAVALPLLLVTTYTIVVSRETALKIREAETRLEELVSNATVNGGEVFLRHLQKSWNN